MVGRRMAAPAEDIKRQVEELHARYIRVVDDGDWEAWPELFTPVCLYRITTRENFDRGLPLSVMECRSRGMLQDRVTGLRKINVYEPHRYLHLASGLAIESAGSSAVKTRSNYLVVRTMLDGAMAIFSAGVYLDKIALGPDGAKFEERVVLADSRRIDTLLALPL